MTAPTGSRNLDEGEDERGEQDRFLGPKKAMPYMVGCKKGCRNGESAHVVDKGIKRSRQHCRRQYRGLQRLAHGRPPYGPHDRPDHRCRRSHVCR